LGKTKWAGLTYIHWLAGDQVGLVAAVFEACFWLELRLEFEEEHLNASYTDGQQSQDGVESAYGA
jgi:hypothetical protein